MRDAPVVPALVLGTSFTGFGALAHSTGFGLLPALYATVFIFALPGQVVLVDQVTRGLPLLSTAIAVSLTAVRFLPLTVSLLPLLRSRKTGAGVEFLAAHFVAVTLWIESMRRLPMLPRQMRLPYYFGLTLILVSAAAAGTFLGYVAAGFLPSEMTTALLFMTPLYFMVGMMSAVRARREYLPLVLGFTLGPVCYLLLPGPDLIITGIAGGTLAYFILKPADAPLTPPASSPPSEA
jgi:predicted branched-subunit amino acid permease